MKKVLCLILMLAMCCSLWGCSASMLYREFVSASGSGVPKVFGKIVLEIQTDSMSPTLKPGDIIVCKEVDPEDLKIGDIITYWTVINGERVLNTHRIYQIYDGGDYLIFETKGDNNSVPDPLMVHEAEVSGIYVRKAVFGFL